MLDFGALPPEINSARMYSGPGSGPLLAAAAAWDALAAELFSAAASSGSMVSGLTAGPWRGPAATSMAAATAPYVEWMSTAAGHAQQTGVQAKAAVAAYETAFAMTVPPPVITANRALLMSLVATNFFGQNTPAIAATEAHYAQMWAQDAAAMYGYAGSSAAASTLTPFAAPVPLTNPSALSGQAAALARATGTAGGVNAQTLSQLTSALPLTLQGLAAPLSGTASKSVPSAIMNWLGLGGANFSSPAGILNFLAGTDGSPMGAFLNNNGLNTLFSSGFYMPGNFLGTMTDFVGLQGAGAAADVAAADATGAAAAASGLGSGAGTLGGLGGALSGGLGGAFSVGMGRAGAIGPLSVPPSWTVATPPVSPVGPLLGGAPLTSPSAGTPGMFGMPLGAMNGHSAVATLPKYGIRPTVIARPLSAG